MRPGSADVRHLFAHLCSGQPNVGLFRLAKFGADSASCGLVSASCGLRSTGVEGQLWPPSVLPDSCACAAEAHVVSVATGVTLLIGRVRCVRMPCGCATRSRAGCRNTVLKLSSASFGIYPLGDNAAKMGLPGQRLTGARKARDRFSHRARTALVWGPSRSVGPERERRLGDARICVGQHRSGKLQASLATAICFTGA